jgi:hypothetical protein
MTSVVKEERKYDKMDEYIKSVYNVFKMVYKKANNQKDQRMKAISMTIYNYIVKMALENSINLNTIEETENIFLIPFFEYVAFHNIEFYDFKNIQMCDVDITKVADLERFVLTHIYYITQKV